MPDPPMPKGETLEMSPNPVPTEETTARDAPRRQSQIGAGQLESHDPPKPKVRVGIDVGGTFTHAVALDAQTLSIVGRAKVPTTHEAKQGVAQGIIDALQALLQDNQITADQVGFIAHSTTQATNALLEGDVAPVGILGMAAGANTWLGKSATNLGRIELAPGKFLTTYHAFLDTTKPPSDEEIINVLTSLTNAGAKAIAVSEAFSVDRPVNNEERALTIARQRLGLLATSGSEVSQLYGLKVRTRTAVINASMLPKMLESANMTEEAVRKAGISAPVMIMRSDGGVMDIESMRRKPILTMLSGPAAGVAAAMMFLQISDGIFLEVGGTSTDISAISNGRALVRPGQVGGHKLYLSTLDVRTVGVAGGSLPRLSNGKIIDVGPRSAHIAGLNYVSFTKANGKAEIKLLQPRPQDPKDYVALSEGTENPTLCLTPTCASNLLGMVPEGDCAFGNQDHIQAAFAVLAEDIGSTAKDAATTMLALSAKKCLPIVKAMIKEYKLDPRLVTLVGGGGGASAIVPFMAQQLGMLHQIAEHADIISAIGVALALIRETIERQIINPSGEDILRLREEAQAAVHKMGADPATIEIHIEVDSRTNTVRATAFGATTLATGTNTKRRLNDEERLNMLAESMRVAKNNVKLDSQTDYFQVYTAEKIEKRLFRILRYKVNSLRVLDTFGTIRLQATNATARKTTQAKAAQEIATMTEQLASWGDAGKVIPDILLLAGPKIIDLSGLLNSDQVQALAKIELESINPQAPVIVVAKLPS